MPAGPNYLLSQADATLMRMTEVDVTLTDYAVTAECAYFTYLLIPARSPISKLAAAFIIFFLSIAVAAVAGGTVHGFFADEKSFGHRLLWPFTLFCVGITAFAGIDISAALPFSSAASRLIDIAGVLVFLAYTVIILFVRSDFRLAVLNYLPSLIFLASAFLIVYVRSGKSAVLVGFAGKRGSNCRPKQCRTAKLALLTLCMSPVIAVGTMSEVLRYQISKT